MATKAELEQELASLRQEMADRPEPEVPAPEGRAEASAPPGDAPIGTGSPKIDEFLRENGIAPEDLQGLMDQLSDELGHLPQNKPILTALGAFAIGFALGRMSK